MKNWTTTAQTGKSSELGRALRAYVERRWTEFALPLATGQMANLLDTRYLRCFSKLRSDPILLSLFAQEISSSRHLYVGHLEGILDLLEIRSEHAARQLGEAVRIRRWRGLPNAEMLALLLWPALARGIGWGAWTHLFGILIALPEYAGTEPVSIAPPRPEGESRHLISSRLELSGHLSGAMSARAVAGHLQSLLDHLQSAGLLNRPAETRSAFVARLDRLTRRDKELRLATIEALLWLGDGPVADLAMFAASRLVRPADRKHLKVLSRHPNPLVGYSADALEQIFIGERPGGARIEPTARHGIAISAQPPPSVMIDEEPRTWVGDRAVERAIEAVVVREERRFADEYPDHHGEGEERLCAMLFDALSKEFESLSNGFETAARLAGAPRAASVQLRYRAVDKPEEGAKGVRGAKRFSTDVCLIVDPVLDGRSLGRRASLVQAKRIYPNRRFRSSLVWEPSYRLKPKQTEELIEQTQSSFFMFHGPGFGGRGLPVMPAQLVSDLALHQGGSGAQLATAQVGSAARSMADWLTYSLLGLRVGDPYRELLDKAGGAAGRRARRLLEIPRVEVSIAVGAVSRPR